MNGTSETEVILTHGTSFEYAIVALGLSIFAVVLATIYSWKSVHAYRIYHDVRAAVTLVKAIGLLMVAIGLTVSASGLIFHSSLFSVVGLSLARGVIVVLLLTLVIVEVRPPGGEK